MSLVCKRIAEETEADPLIVEMDPNKLSIEEQLFDDADFDSSRSSEQSTYPHINSPIPREALIAVGSCEEIRGDFPWPAKFVPLDSIAIIRGSTPSASM